MIRAFNRAMLNRTHEYPAMPRLMAARRRYYELRAALRCDNELDIDLHSELTAVIRALDAKIAHIFPAGTSV